MIMKLSIITVTYNAGELLEPTLRSIVNQNVFDLELLIIDGQSKDNTLEIAHSFNGKVSIMKIVSEPDEGIYDAMNKGIEMANGDYMLFLNAGDIFYDDMVLKRVLPVLNGSDVFYGDSFTKNGNNIFPYRTGPFSKYRLAHVNICHQTIFYPRNALLKHKFKLKYKILADYVTNLYLWKKYPFVYLNTPVALYLGGGASSIVKDKIFAKDYRMIILRTLGLDAFIFLCVRKLINYFRFI